MSPPLQAVSTREYKVDLEVFEGPLDLLLYLIRRDELDIYDIPIEHVTTQYMAYLDTMKMLDLNIAGEFLVMASTLMMIKSRMLLPVEDRPEDDEEEEGVDPRLDLVRQLIEYKKFKDAAARLQHREALRNESFLFGGELAVPPPDMDGNSHLLADVGLFDLLAAFQEVLSRAPVSPLGHLEPILWSVPDKMADIQAKVEADGSVAFSTLFTSDSPRGEVIVTFLALLELLKQHLVRVSQGSPFSEIVISASLRESRSHTPLVEIHGA
ncbi:MAG: segregation and condensation protein A [Kiritimatiellia bacterium]|jgi:segregation and condensation protein A